MAKSEGNKIRINFHCLLNDLKCPMVRIFQHIPPLSLIMMTPSLLPSVHQFSLTYDHPFPPSLTNIVPSSSSNNTPPLPSPSMFLPLAQRTPVEVSVCEPLHTACLQRRSWKSWPLPRTVQCSSPSCRKSPPQDGSTESFGTPDGGDIVGEVSFIAQTLLLFSWSYGVNWLPGDKWSHDFAKRRFQKLC